MKKRFQILIIITLFFIPGITKLLAKEGDSTNVLLKGKVYGRIFSNFHTGINKNTATSGFEVRRAYFGYRADLGGGFEANIKLDIGSPEDLSQYSLIRRYAYFKNAYLRYSTSKLKVSFGIIDLLHFNDQEKYWKHRYIEKVFADQYRFGFKADLGAQVEYKWTKWLITDMTLMNGEGYTKLQKDDTYKAGAGITINPVDPFFFRVYADGSVKNEVFRSATVIFLGSKIRDDIVLGVEYNHEFNSDYKKEQARFGYSLFGSCNFTKKWQIFGRFDKVISNKMNSEENPWNLSNDGSGIISGIEYSFRKGIKFALNYQDWFPYAGNEPNEQFIYFNIEVNF
ncbi:MAG: hypothetical protein K8R53_09485 [Bacteroidales bacterium]|nr:hypothetical protein [Bacteroidales bacterium]